MNSFDLYQWENEEMHPDVKRYGMRISCAVMSRVVGFITDTRNWHKGKVAEWLDRVPYRVQPLDRVIR